MGTVFADLKPLERFTVPGPNPDVVYTKRTPGTYSDMYAPGSWVFEVPPKQRRSMVVVRVPS